MKPRPVEKLKSQKANTGPIAVIDIGATSLRMAIAQVVAGSVEILDTLSQAVSLGKDTFIKGRIENETIEACVRVLKLYRHKLREYKLTDARRIRVVATSAVREATNRLAFLDRVFIATGFEVEPFDEAELHRVTYLSVEPLLKESTSDAQVICEVGGGSTEILVVVDDNIAFSQTYRLGSLRLRKTLEALDAPEVKVREIMQQQIRQTVQQFVRVLPLGRQFSLLGMGGDLRFAVAQSNPDWDRHSLAHLSLVDFEKLTEKILALSIEQICHRYHLSYPDAETLGPAMLVNLNIAQALQVEEILVANTNLRDGLLSEMSRKDPWTAKFHQQVVRFALDLGRKYQFDEAHATHVAKLSETLFDQLQPEHGLDSRHRTILYVAALLHEIGTFIANRSYHKHSMYIIQNSQFFGFGKRDLMLTALVARYHRRAHPQPLHDGFQDLGRKDRVAVSKLAAILRLAVALDESRIQRLEELNTVIHEDRIIISIANAADLSLEQVALRQYSSLFMDTFGKRVVLNHAQV